MIAKVESACLVGMDAAPVHVEVSLSKGLPRLSIIGLPDASVREAKDRVVSAIRHSGFEFPSRRVTVNLAPAELKKEGATFDLAIAIGILAASQAVAFDRWPRCLWLGELALDGALRPVRGALPLVRSLIRQKRHDIMIPEGNVGEVAFLPNVNLFPFKRLSEAAEWLSSEKEPTRTSITVPWKPATVHCQVDFAEIKGQAMAKRALEIAATGCHNVLMIGSPGTGKSLLAQALPGILPAWSLEEALDATPVYSIAGVLKEEQLLSRRPFRNPHHSVSTAGLVGGGDTPMPGEISLAHRGVLFLDELPEFHRDALEALRQPLEEGSVHIHRSRGRASYPADFLLVAAMNPCPCGYRGHPKRDCQCSSYRIQKYMAKISGPLLDRIDLHVELPALDIQELFKEETYAESSLSVQARVEKGRRIQEARYAMTKDPRLCNARLRPGDVRKYCALTPEGQRLLRTTMERLGLSARSFDRIRKVARTIADLEGSATVEASHMAEAIQYRFLDRSPTY